VGCHFKCINISTLKVAVQTSSTQTVRCSLQVKMSDKVTRLNKTKNFITEINFNVNVLRILRLNDEALLRKERTKRIKGRKTMHSGDI
jgi:hypothetical protein